MGEAKYPEVLSLYHSVVGPNMQPSAFILNTTIAAAAHAAPTVIPKLHASMRELGLEPDVVAFNAMLKHFERKKKWTRIVTEFIDLATRYSQQMQAAAQAQETLVEDAGDSQAPRVCTPSSVTLNIVAKAVAHVGDVKAIQGIL